MGLFSFLFGGKKKATPPARPVVLEPPAPAAAVISSSAVAPSIGATQAKLRLKLAAALRSGELGTAYEAAKGLADIQARAGRHNTAREWRQQADRIKATLLA